MSTSLLDLSDRIITDRGEVVARYGLLLDRLMSRKSLAGLLAEDHPDVRRYNHRSDKGEIPIWTDTEEIDGPDPETYTWTFPETYQDLDVAELAWEMLDHLGLTTEVYRERLQAELQAMEERDMFPFVRCLLYVCETLREHGVVWGVGRGSSCASLVMFVLGVNRVDPVLYEIPMREFFK